MAQTCLTDKTHLQSNTPSTTSSAGDHTALVIHVPLPLGIPAEGSFPSHQPQLNTFSEGEVLKGWLAEWLTREKCWNGFWCWPFSPSWREKHEDKSPVSQYFHKLKTIKLTIFSAPPSLLAFLKLTVRRARPTSHLACLKPLMHVWFLWSRLGNTEMGINKPLIWVKQKFHCM